MTFAKALQLEAARRGASCPGLFLANCVLRMSTSCYLPASDEHFDIAIRFSDLEIIKGSNNLAIRRRFHAVTLTFDN